MSDAYLYYGRKDKNTYLRAGKQMKQTSKKIIKAKKKKRVDSKQTHLENNRRKEYNVTSNL